MYSPDKPFEHITLESCDGPGCGGGGGSIDAAAMQSAISTQAGCTTAGKVWSPQTNTCIPSGDNNVATVILAASNSTAAQKAQANIVCTGTNDDACIQSALDTSCPANTTGQVNGCRVVLKAGIYNASATIHQKGNSVTLEGEEAATWGGYRHGSNNTGGGCTTGDPCGDLATGGSQIRSTSNYGPIIEWDATPTPACGPTDSTRSCGLVDRFLYLVGFQYLNEGISGGGQADMSEVDDVMIQRTSNCLNLNTDSGVASKIRCQDAGALGNFGGEHTAFRDGLIFDVNGNCGVFGATIVTGTRFGDCGPGPTDSSPFQFVGNDLYRIFCGQIWFQGSGFGGTFTGNVENNEEATCSSNATWNQFNPDSATGNGAFAISGNSGQTSGTHGQGGYFIDTASNPDNGASVSGNAVIGGFNGGNGAYNLSVGTVSAANAAGFSGGSFYNNSTAYIIGDYVTYAVDGRKYICIANSTGNLPTNGSFWTQLSSTTVPLAAWYKGETIVSGGTGTAITSWPDSSGWPNRQMTVGTGSTLYESSSNVDSLPAARFAGASYLQEAEVQFGITSTSKTIFIAVHPTSSSGGSHEAMFSGGTTLTPYAAWQCVDELLWRWRHIWTRLQRYANSRIQPDQPAEDFHQRHPHLAHRGNELFYRLAHSANHVDRRDELRRHRSGVSIHRRHRRCDGLQRINEQCRCGHCRRGDVCEVRRHLQHKLVKVSAGPQLSSVSNSVPGQL
jgi:hypothetical protein